MSGLSPQDIADRVRRQFGDDDAAQVIDADIVRWINDGQREVCVQHDLMQAVATSPTTANVPQYSLPANILELRRVAYQGVSLLGISADQADALIPTHDQTQAQGYPTGTPSHYWIFAQELNLFPAPATNSTADLTIYYTQTIPDLLDLTGTITVPPRYHNSLVQYCLKQAYELDANIQLLNLKSQEFQGGMDKLRGNTEWQPQDVYPSITSVPEYDLGLG